MEYPLIKRCSQNAFHLCSLRETSVRPATMSPRRTTSNVPWWQLQQQVESEFHATSTYLRNIVATAVGIGVEYIICCYCIWHVCTSLGCPPPVVSQFIFDCCGVAVAKSCCKMVHVTRGSFFRETRHPWKFGGWVFIWHIWDSRFYDLHQCGTARGDLIMILWQSKLILDWNIPRYQAGNL